MIFAGSTVARGTTAGTGMDTDDSCGAAPNAGTSSAIVAARTKIVEGAVGMVEMALDQLSQKNVVELDDERRAAMVSNLMVVLCGERDTQPVVNAGSLYQ